MSYERRSTKDIIETMKLAYGFRTLTEISNYFGKESNWATQMSKKDSVPYPQVAQTCEENDISIDLLIFGVDNPLFNKRKLLLNIIDGLNESIAFGVLHEDSQENIRAIAALVLKQIDK